MRIGLLAPISADVPPDGYGGVEAVLALLADGRVEAGHDVTLFASGRSATKAKLVAAVDEPPSKPGRLADASVRHALECVARAHEFDLVSNHLGVLGGALCGPFATPSVHTVSDPVDRVGAIWERIAELWPRLRLISTSLRQQELAPGLPWVANCYNALDPANYPFRPEAEADGYLAFVGRMSPDKGCREAIDVARSTGMRLRIAAKLEEAHERDYFKRHIEPALGDGVDYVGELDHDRIVDLLGGAVATLFPTDVEEAFGMVLIEAMACGTPIVATRRGAVPEVVADGHTGILVDDVSEMPAAVGRVGGIDRHECRTRVERHFSPTPLVAAYEAAFDRLLTESVGSE
jgi:glycosyltransferase involved in cell wall biosynthesis